jgi:hypothetical protein
MGASPVVERLEPQTAVDRGSCSRPFEPGTAHRRGSASRSKHRPSHQRTIRLGLVLLLIDR